MSERLEILMNENEHISNRMDDIADNIMKTDFANAISLFFSR